MITGRGRAFCAGADLREGFREPAEGHPDVHTRLVGPHHRIINGLLELPKLVVAAVTGPAAGIGCSLALGRRSRPGRRVGVLHARVRQHRPRSGWGRLGAGCGESGLARATEMALLGEPVAARKALESGLVNEVVPDSELAARATSLTERLSGGPTRAYAATKRELSRWAYSQLTAQLALEADEQQLLAATRPPRGSAGLPREAPSEVPRPLRLSSRG